MTTRIPSGNSRCLCHSGQPVRRCCKAERGHRARRLVDFISAHCGLRDGDSLGLAAFSARLLADVADGLAAHRCRAWLVFDLQDLGYDLSDEAQPSILGLGWREAAERDDRRPIFARALLAQLERQRVEVTAVIDQAVGIAAGAAVDSIEAGLLQRIYARPGDDAARLVYGDWLQERGEPRGELIALQIARGRAEPSDREQTLLRLNGRRWLGKLDAVTSLANARFERGFLVSCSVSGDAASFERVLGDPAWSTLRSLRLGHHSRAARQIGRMIADPTMRALRALHGAPWRVVQALERQERPLALNELFYAQHERMRLPSKELFPALSHVGAALAANGAAGLLADSTRRIERLTLFAYGPYLLSSFASQLPALRAAENAPARVSYQQQTTTGRACGLSFTISRGSDRKLSSLRVHWHGRIKYTHLRALLETLDALPPDSLTELVVPPPERHRLTSHNRRRLAQAATRFPQMERLCLP